jgi:hypothetical protein
MSGIREQRERVPDLIASAIRIRLRFSVRRA